MKFLLVLVLLSFSVFGQTVSVVSNTVENSKISIAEVQDIFTIYENEEGNVLVNLVISYSGLSTDLSPTHKLNLGFIDAGEMNNIKSSFEVAYFVGKPEILIGIDGYSVSGNYFDIKTGEVFKARVEVDITKLLSDDKKLRKSGLDDFTDPYLLSSIDVKIIKE